jgi:hypothetical protein
MKLKTTAAAAIMLPVVAMAEFWDGNSLLAKIRGNHGDQMQAIGYIMGVFDAGHGAAHCAPEGVTAGQAVDMTRKFMEDSPELRHFSGDRIVMTALSKAWPCRTSPRRGDL